MITASQLYDHVNCPKRVELDLRGDPERRDQVSAFVRMLWERGSAFEAEMVERLGSDVLNLRMLAVEERERETWQAMEAGAPLIYGGRISAEDLLGEPDLLIQSTGGYVPADIKSGRGLEGGSDEEESDGRPKAHYAVQLGLYSDILQRRGAAAGRSGEIWDRTGDRVAYDLNSRRNSRTMETWWDVYVGERERVRAITAGAPARGALSAGCGLCHWRSLCKEELTASGDLTLIAGLGRAVRDAMSDHVPSLTQFAARDPDDLIEGRRTKIPGLGPDRLRLFHARAVLLTSPEPIPYLRAEIDLPSTDSEIFFDIEADPMRDVTYLHGFIERMGRDPASERFTAFFADRNDAKGEEEAFAQALAFLRERPDATVYYYSKYERTTYRKLQRRYPHVCSAEEIEQLFTPPRAIDLYYDVVFRATEWPTSSQSIKALAKHLGFSWRDTDPSGAASIEWYHRWCECGAADIRQRILDYNEDDCRATVVLLDAIRQLQWQNTAADPTTGIQPGAR